MSKNMKKIYQICNLKKIKDSEKRLFFYDFCYKHQYLSRKKWRLEDWYIFQCYHNVCSVECLIIVEDPVERERVRIEGDIEVGGLEIFFLWIDIFWRIIYFIFLYLDFLWFFLFEIDNITTNCTILLIFTPNHFCRRIFDLEKFCSWTNWSPTLNHLNKFFLGLNLPKYYIQVDSWVGCSVLTIVTLVTFSLHSECIN